MLARLTRRGSSPDGEPRQPPSTNPKIGLVLGGGAARGFAHIGVVRTLRAQGIVPDIIVGTSIGAVVGGCHAAGHLDAFEEWSRSLLPRNIFGYLDFNLSGSGLIGGDKLAAQLDATLGTIRVDDLPVKFAAIATEIRTGHEIWLTHGRLTEAIRASYALPGIFAPVNVGGRWLMDGALVNPVPVSAARALGAEIVIAVNVSADVFRHGTTIASFGAPAGATDVAVPGSDAASGKARTGLGGLFSIEQTLKRRLFGDANSPGISTVMAEAFNIMQDRITRARLAGDPPDIVIAPRVGDIGWFEFHRAEEAIAFGERATERALDGIRDVINIIAPAPGAPAPTAGNSAREAPSSASASPTSPSAPTGAASSVRPT